ncbi:ATP-binding cassette domain-containing protein [Ramlibacter sp. MAHUQ-53]|uniref:ATP-binding cassette domain-containing protein n=1 Tax=unclassified Ramlibacter TaxID=2617605 RepID=UPI0036282C70
MAHGKAPDQARDIASDRPSDRASERAAAPGLAPSIALRLTRVGRAFPPDVADFAPAVLREMLLPRRALARSAAHGLPALAGVDLALRHGERLGVLGAPRSGKSLLAAIAAGVLAPTTGRVHAPASRLLLARPSAGFKPGLALRDNLRLHALLQGLDGAQADAALARAFAQSGADPRLAGAATGHLPPALVRLLALELALALPAQVLVVDDLAGAGEGAARRSQRARLLARLERGAALVFSGEPQWLRACAPRACVLREGRLLGPFPVDEAAALFAAGPAHGPEAGPPSLSAPLRAIA